VGIETVRCAHLKQETVLRVIADAVMLNVAMLMALTLGLYYLVTFNRISSGGARVIQFLMEQLTGSISGMIQRFDLTFPFCALR
jgi:hypothetical protein